MMNDIEQATKDCPREDCCITGGSHSVTLMAWQPQFDRHGNQIGPGDPNISSGSLKCSTCGASWDTSTQYGKTTIRSADLPRTEESTNGTD